LYTSLPDTWQLVYRAGLNHDYFNRPFGLFGQPSINIGILTFVYMIKFYIVKKEQISESFVIKLLYFLLVMLSIYYQQSGSGYLAFLLIIFLLLSRNLFLFLLLVTVAFIGIFNFYFLYQDEISSFSNKISLEYLGGVYNYFYNDIINPYIANLTFLDLLFGIDDNRNIAIDFGPLYILAHTGLIYFILFISFIIDIIIKSRDRFVFFAFLILLILSLHYPIVIYPIPSILFFLLWIYIDENNKGRNHL
jgi:hypothetical protein